MQAQCSKAPHDHGEIEAADSVATASLGGIIESARCAATPGRFRKKLKSVWENWQPQLTAFVAY
jgi:hypothetical protein